MTQTTTPKTTPGDVSGPVDFLLLEFPTDRLTGQAAEALRDLVESGTIHLYDLVVISKDTDGSVAVLEVADDGGGFAVFAGARSGLVGEDDVAEAGEAMQPGTVAALVVWENSWARPFVSAAFNSGGEVIASGRIPAADINAALDALETAD